MCLSSISEIITLQANTQANAYHMTFHVDKSCECRCQQEADCLLCSWLLSLRKYYKLNCSDLVLKSVLRNLITSGQRKLCLFTHNKWCCVHLVCVAVSLCLRLSLCVVTSERSKEIWQKASKSTSEWLVIKSQDSFTVQPWTWSCPLVIGRVLIPGRNRDLETTRCSTSPAPYHLSVVAGAARHRYGSGHRHPSRSKQRRGWNQFCRDSW